ncbi:MAG: hypothetical protein M3235_10720, partial [Actinomycetota bacterium]|nr:hypothetical protein [Actinomycetota bacterium]
MTRHTQRRRIVAATVVSGALLLVGPAAYGVATAADSVDNPIASVTQDPLPDDDGDGGDGGQSGQGEDPNQGGDPTQDAGQDQGAEQSQEAGAGQAQPSGGDDQDAGNEQGAKDGKQAADEDKKNGLDVLASDCTGSKLEPHDGFQKAPRCVSTAFGEVGS